MLGVEGYAEGLGLGFSTIAQFRGYGEGFGLEFRPIPQFPVAMALVRQEAIAGRGRGMLAIRRILAGEVLLRESPLLVYEEAEAASTLTFCSNCLRSLHHRQPLPCSTCNASTFCSNACFSHHEAQTCKALSALLNQKLSYEDQTLARFLIEAYTLDSASSASLLELEGQPQDATLVKKLNSFLTKVVVPVNTTNVETTMELLARDACNTFGLMAPSKPGEERKVRGYAIYAQASMFNHDCLPNACRFDYVDGNGDGDGDGKNTDVIVRALQDIEEGDEVCLSYFPLDWPYGDRQKKLREEYGFWCKCARCKVESEWKDDSDQEEEGGAQDADGDGKVEDVAGDEDEGEEGEEDDDFGHAMFFVKFLCPVDDCGGTMAPLPPGEVDSQGLRGSMECNFCGHVRSDEEFLRDLEEHAVEED